MTTNEAVAVAMVKGSITPSFVGLPYQMHDVFLELALAEGFERLSISCRTGIRCK
jgi:hypothetical protein